jgi:hypothetical protein
MQSENIRINHTTNYRLTQYKKKNKLKNKSQAIEQLLANDSLRSHIAEKLIADIPNCESPVSLRYLGNDDLKQKLRDKYLNK